ncbi:hypothetical protein [Ensifer sp. ENS07]|uniref:hypothetical protein n=1 Tax=Ensifer sp. ENS07 TaxID=2769274 RepID=UPI001AEE8E26|nr:hypothetical protein [Ensifer sp. ENS07]
MLRMHSLNSNATFDERAEAFGAWFDADVDAAISLVPLVDRLGANLERIVGKEQASKAFAQLHNCDENWREAVEQTEFYLETELGADLTGLSAYAMFGLTGQGYLEEAKVQAILRTLEALLLDCPPAQWLPDVDAEPILPTLTMARARWNLDHGVGIEAEGLALLGGVKLSRIRNMMSGSTPELPKDVAGMLSNEAARAWLERRDCFLPTIARDSAAMDEDAHEPIVPVFVPVARDGSMFLPNSDRNGLYRIGEKGSEESFNDYEKALAKLQSMPVAKWRRANDQGNWGIVSAIDWRRMDLKTL